MTVRPNEPLLEVRDLTVRFRLGDDWASAVNGVSFALAPGETLGLAGESGSGKSTVALALMRLLEANGEIAAGAIRLKGHDLARLGEKELMPYRWKEMALVFQGAMNALNPVKSVGSQIAEALTVRGGLGRKEAWARVEELFRLIGIRPERARDYPHEFSGGMRQRAMIAMAVALDPAVVIADECTTALDVMIQHQIMELLEDLKRRLGLAMLFINHDLALVAEICDRVAVMYAGRIVEIGPVEAVFAKPAHPYVQLLVASLPRLDGPVSGLASIPGAPPRLKEMPPGCPFRPRCPFGGPECEEAVPPLMEVGEGHAAACIKIEEIARKGGAA